MAGARVSKGSKAWGGPNADWECRVTGFTKNGIQIKWLTGPLADRDACVDKSSLRRKRGDKQNIDVD